MNNDKIVPKGIPYSLNEVRLVIETHVMDEYHRDLMKYLLGRVVGSVEFSEESALKCSEKRENTEKEG